jgi:serine phosphatase RsbU (regulator of sigma subunit)
LAIESDPALAVRRINETFSRDEWADRFITFVVAIVDVKTHDVTLVNAGHMAPLLRKHSGKVTQAPDDLTGVPLGVQADYPYAASHLKLEPGESLTIYTDGFSEAMNPENELYGLDNLIRQVGQKALDVDEVGQHIVDDVRLFAGGQPQSDDMCLVCFGRLGG